MYAVNSLTISSSFENIDLGIPFALGIQSEDLYHNLNGNLDNLHMEYSTIPRR